MDIFNKEALKEREDFKNHAMNLVDELGTLANKSNPLTPYPLRAEEIHKELERIYKKYAVPLYYPCKDYPLITKRSLFMD